MPEHPHTSLLHIHTDQHNPFVTGCYGDPIVATPNLDRLARIGVTFDNAYCTSPICVPSRMSMLTGQHPHQMGVWTNDHALDSSIPTFAHALGAAGYRPVLVGRMHARGPDQLHGYVERWVGDHSPNQVGGVPVDRGALEGTAGPDRISLEKSGPGQSAYQIHDEYVTAAAIDYLNREGIRRRSGRASHNSHGSLFCLSVGFMLPHPPYVAHREIYETYRDQVSMPRKLEPFSDALHPHLRWWRLQTGLPEVSARQTRRARAAYWGLVSQVDRMIGQILSAVRENDLEQDLLIVYTSDHGDMLGEHGLWWKHTFYEESAKVPLIVAWPGVIPAHQRCRRVVSAVDVTATLLEALGTPSLPNSSGKSFLHLLTGQDGPWEDLAFAEYCSDTYCPQGGCYQRMIRQDAWKLVYYHGLAPQLFDLSEDPDEMVDRAGDPASRAIREDLENKILEGWDPGEIAAKMAAKRADNELFQAWGQRTHPPEQYRWTLKPEMNYLD